MQQTSPHYKELQIAGLVQYDLCAHELLCKQQTTGTIQLRLRPEKESLSTQAAWPPHGAIKSKHFGDVPPLDLPGPAFRALYS